MLTVATWNLENFFRPGVGAGPTSQAAYEAKVGHLKATITAIAPDVLGVQEVGQPEALEDLRVALGGNWHAIASQHHDGRGIRVGFLSTLPFAEHEDVVAFPDLLKRSNRAMTAPSSTKWAAARCACGSSPTPRTSTSSAAT